ncbi:MAG: hypothetical protein GEU86_09820 [Actinophytocola sp.]|nr:hypothetical protein [Actinophytocola sp.]
MDDGASPLYLSAASVLSSGCA